MERLLFARVPVWVVLALAIVALLGMIGFGVLVYDQHGGGKRFGALSRAAAFLASAPEEAWQDFRKGDPLMALQKDRFGDRRGWNASPGTALEGYVLLSRHDGDLGRHAVELVDLASFETVHRWEPDAETLFDGVEGADDPARNALWKRHLFRSIHPVITADGGLIIKDHQSPLFRLDFCGDLVWRTEETMFHHSTEIDADGSFWVPGERDPGKLGLHTSDRFRDDTIARVSAEGSLLENRSLTEVLLRSGLIGSFMTDNNPAGKWDPMHLNDIEAVPGDGPHWQAGDLFLSLRNMSTIALYRPSEDRIVWHKRGPWLTQHDVDILDDHTISVFSNNTYNLGTGQYIYGSNEVMIYDFATDTVTSPWKPALEGHDVITISEGLADAMPGGAILVEEENSGRILILAADGTVLADYVNRAADGHVYRLGWSRYMDRAAGDRAAAAAAAAGCGE